MSFRRRGFAGSMDGRSRSHGFTLLELLIVIGVIAILLTILFPVVGRVQNAAKNTKTQTLIRDVRTAIETFRTERGRAPGYFTQRAMAQPANKNDRGFTNTENVILELAGGVYDGEEAVDDLAFGIADVGPGATAADQVDVDASVIGSSDGPAYLTLDDETLRPVRGQVSPWDMYDETTDEIDVGMPDIVDPFGQPLLIFSQDRAVPKAINRVEQFAKITLDPGSEDAEDRAAFYWTSNAGYLRSGDSDAPGQDVWRGLGRDQINQNELSAIGGLFSEGGDAETLQKNLAAILGSPTFPGELNPTLPSRARGDMIIIAAGEDRTFFERGPSDEFDALGYGPDAFVPTDDTDEGDGLGQTPDSFDDLIEATGG